MAITEITAKTLGKKKSGWHWDKKRGLFVSWQVDTTFDGSRHVKRGFPTEKAAGVYLDQLKVQERLKAIGVVSLVKYPTVKKLFAIHLEKFPTKKARTAAARAYRKFESLLVPKNLTIDELKRKHFKDYVDLRIQQGVKPESANREITDISAALHKTGEYFAELEKWTVPKIYRPPISDEGRSRVIAQTEWTRIVKNLLNPRNAPTEHKKDYRARRRTGLIFYFGLLTGLRHGEISGLRKTNYDRRSRSLKAERFKTKKSGVSWTTFEPLTPTQIWILNEAGTLYPDGEFFFSETGKPHNKFYEIMRAACEKLKIDYGKSKPNGFVMHDTRHTFVTVLEHGAVDSSTTRSFSGHTRDGMMKRYAHATNDSRTKAMAIIEREFGAGKGFDPEAELKEVFREAQSGRMSFDKFKKTIESFSGYFAKTQEIDVADVADVIEKDSDFVQ